MLGQASAAGVTVNQGCPTCGESTILDDLEGYHNLPYNEPEILGLVLVSEKSIQI